MKCSLNVKNSRSIVLLLQLSLIKRAQTTLAKRGTTQTIRKDKVLNLEIIIKATRIIMDTCSFNPFNQGNRFLGSQGRPPFNPPQICVVCQLCDKARHTARVCRSRPPSYFTPKENFMAREPQIHNANWVIDSGASHHITSDLQNLSIHSEYGGTDDVIIGDGNGISITHTDSTNLIIENPNFMFGNVLCAPAIHKNLIFVSQFCKHNCTSIEFFPTYFLVKDLSTGATLV